MYKCEILELTKDGYVSAGSFTLVDGRIVSQPTKGNDKFLQSILLEPFRIDDKQVYAKDNPEAWFMALPSHYWGDYLKARMVK